PHAYDLADGNRKGPVDRIDLGHVADPVGRPRAHRPPEHADLAPDVRYGAEQGAQQRGLARARRAADAAKGAAPEGQREALEDRLSVIRATEVPQADERLG